MRQETKTKAVSLATKSPIFCASILQSLLTASRDKRTEICQENYHHTAKMGFKFITLVLGNPFTLNLKSHL